jgi:hypothetical protein
MEHKVEFAPNVKEKMLEYLLSIMGNIDLMEMEENPDELLKIMRRLKASTSQLKEALREFEESIPMVD